jgi:D-amino peptidase
MKVHISADMEGIAVLAHDDQTDQKGFDYGRMREIMTAEVEAAIRGAKDGGADEVLVCDAHDTGRNLLVEKMDEDFEVIQGAPYELGMMAGISESFDASFQVGYHSMRHTHAGTLGHTYTYSIAELKLNGVTVGETGLSAAIAGHFGVPLVFVSGDLHAITQAKRLVPGVVGVPTKEGVGVYGARSLTPRTAQEHIKKGAKQAMEKMHDIKPYVLKKPIQMEVVFEKPLMAQYASQIPLVKRKDVSTVVYKARDIVEAFNLFDVFAKIGSYAKSEGSL